MLHPKNRVLDVSLEMEHDAAPVPGDPLFTRTLALDIPTHGCEVAALSMSAHHGTHMDFPAHFIPEGRRQKDYPPESFILPALVLETAEEHPRILTRKDIEHCDIAKGEALLLHTANSRLRLNASGSIPPSFTSLSQEAAAWLAQKGTPLVGIDACSIEPLDSKDYPVHKTLLGKGVLILEGLDLSNVAAGRYTLLCAPLSIANGEASPVRALLVV